MYAGPGDLASTSCTILFSMPSLEVGVPTAVYTHSIFADSRAHLHILTHLHLADVAPGIAAYHRRHSRDGVGNGPNQLLALVDHNDFLLLLHAVMAG